jgi:hypothetical protein
MKATRAQGSVHNSRESRSAGRPLDLERPLRKGRRTVRGRTYASSACSTGGIFHAQGRASQSNSRCKRDDSGTEGVVRSACRARSRLTSSATERGSHGSCTPCVSVVASPHSAQTQSLRRFRQASHQRGSRRCMANREREPRGRAVVPPRASTRRTSLRTPTCTAALPERERVLRTARCLIALGDTRPFFARHRVAVRQPDQAVRLTGASSNRSAHEHRQTSRFRGGCEHSRRLGAQRRALSQEPRQVSGRAEHCPNRCPCEERT